MSEFPLPIIAVSGSPAELGAGYGAAAADLIAANNAAYLDRFRVRANLTPQMVRAEGARFRETTLEYEPRIAAMLDGVADASGVAVEEIYALNARSELLYGTLVDLGECTVVGLLGSAGLPGGGSAGGGSVVGGSAVGGSAGAVGGSAVGGGTVIGQNWDWHPEQRPYTVLLATTDEHGFSVATLAEAGMLAKTGLNSAGLGVCVNLLGSDRDGQPGGVPYHVLVRMVLEATELAGAVRAVCQSPRSASINLLIGQAYDGPGGGEILDAEVVPGDIGFCHPDGSGRIVHANHLETTLSVRDTLKDFGGSSFFRAARARRLLAQGMSMAEVFADHAGYPHAICRHTDPRDSYDEASETVYSVQLDLDARRIGVATGPPCGSSYVWAGLDELAKGEG
jgi:isopenicillin-N N-acyltransferase like protein